MKRTLSIGLLLVIAAAANPGGVTAQDFNWQGRLERGKVLEIRGINGSIHAVPASGGEVRVTAEKTARRSDPDDVRIEVVEHADGITVCAVYPSRGTANECKPGGGRESVRDNDVTVDFEVQVPPGIELSAHTVNGEISTGSIEGNVRARTVNGDIQIAASGLGEAVTVNGSIRASVGTASDDLEFETVNGTITVELPAGINVNVRASTVNGGIESDFPLTVEGRFGPKRINGTIGSGGPTLSMSTVNGEIRIQRR